MPRTIAKKELLFSLTKKDFQMETFRAGGKGGQNQNKRDMGVRIRHQESGAVGESREHRTQLQNKKAAFTRLVESPKFKLWHRLRCSELLRGVSIEDKIDLSLSPENLLIEQRNPETGDWSICPR